MKRLGATICASMLILVHFLNSLSIFITLLFELIFFAIEPKNLLFSFRLERSQV